MAFELILWIYLLLPIFGLWFVFKKAGVAPWKSIIPVYNLVVWIKYVLGKSWKWYIYMAIPAINIFTYLLLVVETAKVFQRNGLLEQTLAVIFPFIYLPYLGLSKKRVYTNPKDLPQVKASSAREWLDALIFALVAATIIRTFIFELYNIPSSSMEKSLQTGDFLYVSKMAYGPRFPMTPIAIPLIHHSIPGTDIKSFCDCVQLPYHRYGKCNVERFDATVFNFPDGDTVSLMYQSNESYHALVRQFGRDVVNSPQEPFGKIITRPVDKRENFIKRTIGLPGETLQIKNRVVYINGKPIENPKNLQYKHIIELKNGAAPMSADELLKMGISNEDASMMQMVNNYQITYLPLNKEQLATVSTMVAGWEPLYRKGNSNIPFDSVPGDEKFLTQIVLDMGMGFNWGTLKEKLLAIGVSEDDFNKMPGSFLTLPLTGEKAEMMKSHPSVAAIYPAETYPGYKDDNIFPHTAGYNWNVDNFGPICIPKKGQTVKIDMRNLPLYRRVIEVFEGNKLEVRGGQILINGKIATEYTFKMDYFWEMGDNRHNSADSRFWGFVPEDHIVGKASRVIFSWDKDQKSFFKKIRWNRIFRSVSDL